MYLFAIMLCILLLNEKYISSKQIFFVYNIKNTEVFDVYIIQFWKLFLAFNSICRFI